MTSRRRPQPPDPTVYEPRYTGEPSYRFQRKTGSFRPRRVWRSSSYNHECALAVTQEGHRVVPWGWEASAKDAWEDEQEYYADNTLFRRPRESP